ncbi:MAG TPA: hypothetical protein VK053_20245 [Jiangellaceae bacterium]|nr:hypothetical protein [Jiangellaceae bacterium]
MTERSAREILEDVAAGRIDPAEAANLLDATTGVAETADRSASTAAPDARVTDDPTQARNRPEDFPVAGTTSTDEGEVLYGSISNAPAMVSVERIVVHANSRRVRVVGDPTVATLAVEGSHTLRREGGTVHVAGEVEMMPTDDAFSLISGGRWREMAERVQTGLGQTLGLTVRVRPDIALGVEVIAGSATVEGASAVDHVRVTAGSLRVTGAQHPMDVLVQAGSAQVEALVVAGRSRVRCESGSLHMRLAPGSDTRVRTDVQLGRLSIEPPPKERDKDREIVVGTGGAELDVEGLMATVSLELPQ